MPEITSVPKAGDESVSANELEKLYAVYFTPPIDVHVQNYLFNQVFEEVSLFDYSLSSYSTDSVTPCKVAYA